MSGTAAAPPIPTDSSDLTIERLSVRFGGLVAVNDVSLRARDRAITGLIGPNGAGKTTIFNACTGLVTPSAGTIHFGRHELGHHSTAWRARLGLGRTFQRMELFESMDVRDNVAVGREALTAGRRRWTGRVLSARHERQMCLEKADEALEYCKITHLASAMVGGLSTGQRRLVELSRALAAGFRCLLMDEPSSGLDVHETERFAEILRGVIGRDGIGILLVEHDMALVRAVCDYTYVLDFGRIIFEGSTEDVLSAEIVKAAYLGSEAADVAS